MIFLLFKCLFIDSFNLICLSTILQDSYQLILELKKVDMRNTDEESQLKQISESLNR